MTGIVEGIVWAGDKVLFDWWRPLRYESIFGAIRNSRMDLLKRCVAVHGGHLNRHGSTGHTPLTFAAFRNEPAMAQYLIEHKADPTVTNADGQTPLDIAAPGGAGEVCSVLLEAGAPLLKGVIRAAPADLGKYLESWKPGMRRYGLWLEAPREMDRAARDGDVKALEDLIKQGALVNEITPYRAGSPLLSAAEYGRLGAMQYLLEHKAEVSHTDDRGDFPLRVAAFRGYRDVCELLLKARADAAMKFEGKTAAQWAVFARRPELAALLTSQSESKESKDAKAAASSSEADSVSAVPKPSPKIEKYEQGMIHDAVAAGDLELTQRCLELRADVDEIDLRQGRSNCFRPLVTAADAGRAEIAKFLVEQKATLSGCGALHSAAKGGRRDVCEVLLNAGIDRDEMWHWLDGNPRNYPRKAADYANDRPELRDFILSFGKDKPKAASSICVGV